MSRSNHNKKPKGKKLKAHKTMVSLAGTTRSCFNMLEIKNTLYIRFHGTKDTDFIINRINDSGFVISTMESSSWTTLMAIDYYQRNNKENKKKFNKFVKEMKEYIISFDDYQYMEGLEDNNVADL